jgi:hypothetical protein
VTRTGFEPLHGRSEPAQRRGHLDPLLGDALGADERSRRSASPSAPATSEPLRRHALAHGVGFGRPRLATIRRRALGRSSCDQVSLSQTRERTTPLVRATTVTPVQEQKDSLPDGRPLCVTASRPNGPLGLGFGDRYGRPEGKSGVVEGGKASRLIRGECRQNGFVSAILHQVHRNCMVRRRSPVRVRERA